MSDSSMTVSGNLTRDPELRFTQSGKAVCNLCVAVQHRYQKDGEWVEEPTFLNVVAWGTLGENASASLTKGARVVVEGRPVVRSYVTAEGEKRSTFELIANDIGTSLRWATAEPVRNNTPELVGASNGAGAEPF